VSAAAAVTAREQGANSLVRAVLAVYFLTCLWFGYELSEANHLGVPHLATLGLAVFAFAVLLYRRRVVVRRPWGTGRDRWLFAALAVYVVLRLIQSAGNQFFFGQASKLVLVVLGWICYKVLDPEGELLPWICNFLPFALAAMIAVGMVLWILSGEVGVERFHVGPNEYEYVSEYTCHILPLALLAIDTARVARRKLALIIATSIIFIGLILTGSRGPLVGAVLALITYALATKRSIVRALLLLAIVGTLVWVLRPLAYGTGAAGFENRLSIESTDPNVLLSGRLTHWAFEIGEVTSSTTWIIFGSGLGRFAEWVPDPFVTGGFYRTANVNALLAAWVPFGLFALFGYLYLYRYLWRRAKLVPDIPFRAMLLSLLIAYIFTDQFETHWQGTRMLWYVSFILYLTTLWRPAIPAVARQRRWSSWRSVLHVGTTAPQRG
jgi:O-Antigen ligase